MAQSQTDADFNAAFFGTPSPSAPAQAPANDDAAFNAAFFGGEPAATPKGKPQPQATPSNDEGKLGAFVRGAANGATFGLADLAAAAGDATIPLNAKASTAPSWSQRYHENLTNQAGQTAADRDQHSGAYLGGSIAGAVANPATRALPAPTGLMGAIGQGAGVGGAYGLGEGLSNQDSAQDLGKDVATGAAFGGALPVVPSVAKGIAKGAGYTASGLLGLTTGAGQRSIQGAYAAGREGGKAAEAFKSSISGETPWSDVVDQAKTALGNMRAERNELYRSGMVDISKDPTVLSFAPLDKAVADVSNVKNYKGQDLSKSTASVREEITSTIDHWKALDPAQFHTPEGFDALKQQIGDIKDNLPYGSPQRVVAERAYNAVRQTITEQAPAYGKVMSDYAQASQELDNIQRELSLKPTANPDTALRKLQSAMRDNVNTSWGKRVEHAEKLARNGADTIVPSLAGQALHAAIPHGLMRLLSGGEAFSGLSAAVMGHPGALAATIPGLLASSPRLMGNVAYGAGATARGLSSIAPDLGPLTQRVGLGGLVGGLSPFAGSQPNTR